MSAVASRYVQTLIKILLHIPKESEICHMMAVGYPDMAPPPYESSKDIFCLRMERTVNAYRKLSIDRLELPVSGAPIGEQVQLRIVPDKESGLAEIRFWYDNKLVGVRKVKNEDLNSVHF